MSTTLFTELPPLDQPPPKPLPQPTHHANAGRGRTVALISKHNTVGLTVDMDLMDDLLSSHGFHVRRVDWKATTMPVADIGIFLELFNPTLAYHCKKTIGIFNPEWFLPHWKRHLKGIGQIWCKSREAQDFFNKFNRDAHYTGFFSRDLLLENHPRERTFLHMQGRSLLKGTDAVLEAWRMHTDLPHLTVITTKPVRAPANVTVLGRLPIEELVAQVNTHRFHLCPSRAEGWGHYITEALSAGAHVITTDASPMNEHVHAGFGTLVTPSRSTRRFDVREHHHNPDHIADAVRTALTLDDATLDAQGEQARAHFLRRNDEFRRTALTLLEKL